MKEAKNQNLWIFKLRSQEITNVSIWIIIRIQQRDRQNSQKWKNDTFCMLPDTFAQRIAGTEKYPDGDILINYDNDEYVHGYTHIKEAFRALTKDDILQPYISDHDFGSSNDKIGDVGYNLYVFDIRYQQNFTASQLKVEIKLDGVVPNNVDGYVLVLKNELVSVSTNILRHFDLI